MSYFGLSVEEALRAATIGGAHALRAPDRGAMVRGRLADMVLWDADHEGAFVWSYGLTPRRVWLGGEPISAVRRPRRFGTSGSGVACCRHGCAYRG